MFLMEVVKVVGSDTNKQQIYELSETKLTNTYTKIKFKLVIKHFKTQLLALSLLKTKKRNIPPRINSYF